MIAGSTHRKGSSTTVAAWLVVGDMSDAAVAAWSHSSSQGCADAGFRV